MRTNMAPTVTPAIRSPAGTELGFWLASLVDWGLAWIQIMKRNIKMNIWVSARFHGNNEDRLGNKGKLVVKVNIEEDAVNKG